MEIGSELSSLTQPAYDGQWRMLIAGVRARFSGRILYAANWDEYRHVTFFDALDAIGIDAYFPLASGTTPREEEIVRAWTDYTDRSGSAHHYVAEIDAVQAKFGKPVLFTEVGYASGPDNLAAPWAFATTYDAAAQQRAIAAALRVLADKPWFHGVWIWEWQADPALTGKLAGGAGDLSHTPQGKPAQDTLTEWFTAPAPVPVPAPVPPPVPAPAPAPAPVPVPAPAPPPAPVNTAPTVTLTRPGDGSFFSGLLTLAATASDDAGAARVEFRVDGKFVKTSSAAPFETTWTVPRKLAYGPHTVTATAFDAAGLSASATAAVTRTRSTTTLAATAASTGASPRDAAQRIEVRGTMRTRRATAVTVPRPDPRPDRRLARRQRPSHEPRRARTLHARPADTPRRELPRPGDRRRIALPGARRRGIAEPTATALAAHSAQLHASLSQPARLRTRLWIAASQR